jgi:3-hydroxyacyl-[acyl-carrier-protein] dehydratase
MPTARLHIDQGHPSFEGHFPARPIVPGVLLLEQCKHTVETQSGLVISGLKVAKFLSPALPGELLELEYEATELSVTFTIMCGTRKIAIGSFQLTPSSTV